VRLQKEATEIVGYRETVVNLLTLQDGLSKF